MCVGEVQNEEYWKSKQNQRDFLNRMAKKYEISHWNDWYRVKQRNIEESGGRGLLKMYGGSHISAIMSNFPGSLSNAITCRIPLENLAF